MNPRGFLDFVISNELLRIKLPTSYSCAQRQYFFRKGKYVFYWLDSQTTELYKITVANDSSVLKPILFKTVLTIYVFFAPLKSLWLYKLIKIINDYHVISVIV